MIRPFWSAFMGVMNFIGLINYMYEDVIRTLSILQITVLIAPYPNEKQRAKLLLTIM